MGTSFLLEGLDDQSEGGGGAGGGAAAGDADDLAGLPVDDADGGVGAADLGQLLLDDAVLLEQRLHLVVGEDDVQGHVDVVEDVEAHFVGQRDTLLGLRRSASPRQGPARSSAMARPRGLALATQFRATGGWYKNATPSPGPTDRSEERRV